MVKVVFTSWFMTLNHLSKKEKWLHTNKAFNLDKLEKESQSRGQRNKKRNSRDRNPVTRRTKQTNDSPVIKILKIGSFKTDRILED